MNDELHDRAMAALHEKDFVEGMQRLAAQTAKDKPTPQPLTKGETRAVLALVRERDELTRQANEQLAEIEAALGELRTHYVTARGLTGPYRIEADGRGGLQLVGIPEAAPQE